MGDFFKKFGSGSFMKGFKGLRGSPGGKGATKEAAKDVAKKMAKEYAKKMATKALTSKVAVVAGAFLGKIIIIVAAVAILVFPLSYAMILYQGALNSLYEFTIKTETNFLNEMETFFKDKTDFEALNGVAANYENFLIKRFTNLNDKILDGTFTDGEAGDARSVAIGWVYGKIYSSFFKAPTFIDEAKEWLFGDVNELTKTYVLKPVGQTALEVYTPTKGSNVEDSRKEVFGDSINLYDIEAFDYMAGTLYDLMQLDVTALKNKALVEHKEEIDAKIEEVKLNEARKQVKEILNNWALKVQYISNETNGFRKELKDLGLPNDKLVAYGKSSGIHNLHTFMKNNYSYTSSVDYKWFINKLDSVDNDGCEKGNSAEKVAIALIQKSSDIERLADVASEIENVYVEFIKSFGKTTEQQTTLKNKAKEYFESTPFENLRKTYYDKYAYAIHDTDTEVANTISMMEVSKAMEKMIKDLNLARTQQAAVTYRNYLTELEDVTTIKYYAFDMKNELFDFLYQIPNYDLNFFVKHANSKKDIDSLTSSDKYYKGYDGAIKNAKEVQTSIDSIKENIFVSNDTKLIVSGIDTKSNVDYLTSSKDVVASGLYNYVVDSIKRLEEIQVVIDASKNPDSPEHKQVLSQLEDLYWEDALEIYQQIYHNEFFVWRYGLTDYYGADDYKERSKANYEFQLDLINHTTNSEYFQGFSTGEEGFVVNAIPYVLSNGVSTGEVDTQKPPFPEFIYGFLPEDKRVNSYYAPMLEFHNELLTSLIDSLSTISLLRGEPTIKNEDKLDLFYDRINQLLSKEIEKLNAYKDKIKTVGSVTPDNDPYGILVDADITSLSKGGASIPRDEDFIINKNELRVTKFKYTQEEAVKKTAETCFADIVAKFRNNSKHGIVMNIGDLAIGANAVPGGEDYDSFERALKFLPIVEKVVKENGDLIDPYYLVAMIAAESSGIERPYVEGDANAGIMQIGSIHFGNTFTLPNGEKVKADPYKIASDPETAIKLGFYFANKSAKSFEGNLFMGIVGYNMGDGAMYRIIFLTLVGQGKVDMNAWTTPGSDWASGIKDKAVRDMMVDYMVSGDLDWLNYRKAYQDENWYSTGLGTAHHLERVLSYYDTSQGMPWYRTTEGGPKVIMGSSSGSDMSIGDDSEGNKIYHKNNRLLLWKEYYTDKDIFKKLDNWFSQNAEVEAEKAYLLSDTIIERINSLDSRYENKFGLIDVDPLEFKALVAGTLNIGTTAFVDGKTDTVVSCAPGFKVNPATIDSAKKLVDAVALDYIDIYSGLNGKDKDFALYLYFSNNRDLAKIEIQSEEGSFADFVKKKYQQDQESFTSPSSIFVKIAQVLTGDLNVNAKDFYNLLDNIGSGGENAIIQNPIDLYYEEWLKSKYLMHESYNTMISRTNDERKKDGLTPYPLLPTYEEAVLNKNKNNTLSDIEGTLTVKGPNGELYSVQIRKKFLSNQGGSATPSYIVIHDTGDGGLNGTAGKQYEIMNSTSAKETMHYVVGTTEILHLTENSKAANHINDSATSTGGAMPQITNSNSLGVQFEASVTRNKDKVFWHTVAITKYLMEQYNIQDYDNVVLHNDVTGVEDSKIMLDKDKEEWIKFKEALKNSTVTFSINNSNLIGTAYKLVETARSLLGQPYVYGAAGEILTDDLLTTLKNRWGATGEYEKTDRKYINSNYMAFDCSSFVQYVYSQNGISIGRSTDEQMGQGEDVFAPGETVTESKLQPGDLIFQSGHVMMWIGNGEYIHASQPGDLVKIGKGIPNNIIKVKRFIKGSGSFEFYSQHDPRWAGHSFGDDNVSGSGCAPTSTAMVLSGLKYTNSRVIDKNNDSIITPDELADFIMAKGAYVYNAGTSTNFYGYVSQELNIPIKTLWAEGRSDGELANILAELKAALRSGKAVVASYNGGHWIPYGGHLIALVGIDNNDQIIVHDPNLNSYEDVRDVRFNGPNPDSNIIGGLTNAKFFVIFG